VIRNPHEAAGHHPPSVAGPRQEQPQRERARLQPAVAPNWRGRKRNGLLGHEVDTAVGDLLQYARSLVGLEHRAENLPSFAMARQLAEKGRCDHHLVEPIDNLVARARRPSHHVATLGSARSLPSTVGASAGRKLNSARASTTPEPSALAITTVPSRTACTKPARQVANAR